MPCTPNPANCLISPQFPNNKAEHEGISFVDELANDLTRDFDFNRNPREDGTFEDIGGARECVGQIPKPECQCEPLTVPGLLPFTAQALIFRTSILFRTDWSIGGADGECLPVNLPVPELIAPAGFVFSPPA